MPQNDQTNQPVQVNQVNQAAFADWLKANQALLAQFTAIVQQFIKDRNSSIVVPPASNPDSSLPQEWHAGAQVILTVEPITDAELDALTKSHAEAEVIEKAVQRILGFIQGFMWGAI